MHTPGSAALLRKLAGSPFNLGVEDILWVESTLETLSVEEQLSQLFNVFAINSGGAEVDAIASRRPGAVTIPPWGEAADVQRIVQTVTAVSRVPPLVSADLEGGVIAAQYMTPLTNQLGMAAMDDLATYQRAVEVMGREGASLGICWSFAPVLDINADFRSAIVGTRSFGSDIGTIETLGLANIRAFQGLGIAATAKHWPGEGYDSRDQHLVTTINPLQMSEWRRTFGELYRVMISAGVLTIMSAHIALPAYASEQGVTGIEMYRPASISHLLNVKLLRDELGFNGLITSDATTMGGLMSWGSRATVLPEVIESGCDMILFTPDMDVDMAHLKSAVSAGRLTRGRIAEAAMRVLALKAALGLHRAGTRRMLVPNSPVPFLRGPEHIAIAERSAALSPTLVKDVQGVLPLSIDKHRRILLISEPDRVGFAINEAPSIILDRLLVEAGFEVSRPKPGKAPFSGSIDLVLYVLAQESLLTKSHIYLNWSAMQGLFEMAMQRSWHDIPTALISFGHPYYLHDAPRMPCVINAYSAIEPVQRAVVRKLLGQEAFTGRNPVDPFCGLADAHF